MIRQSSHFVFALLVFLVASTLNPVYSQLPGKDETPFCGAPDWQPGDPCDVEPTDVADVGEPRTVRLIYFLPNDRTHRPEVVQRMKDEIRAIQTFYADQMEAHEFGAKTFRVETDSQGEPTVHVAYGLRPDSYYIGARRNAETVLSEIGSAFNSNKNVYLIVIDNSTHRLTGEIEGLGRRHAKTGGIALVTDEFHWAKAAHELGHAFGLEHNFHDGAYIMSYGPGFEQLSASNAAFLVGHPYFNPDVPIKIGSRPSIKLVSSRGYPADSQNVSLEFKIADSGGLLQALLFVRTIEPHSAAGLREVKAYRGLGGERDIVVQFDYDGVIPSNGLTNLSNPFNHPIIIQALDAEGDWRQQHFTLSQLPPNHIGSLKGHTDSVNSVSFSPDGRVVASASDDGAIKLWNIASQEEIATLAGHAESVTAVAFSPDGHMLASGAWDGSVMMWDATTRQNIGAFQHDKITSVAYSPDGSALAAASRNWAVKLWNTATNATVITLTHFHLTSVAYSPDGSTLAAATQENGIRLWDMKTNATIATLQHTLATTLSYSPDGETLVSGSRNGIIKLWDVATNSTIRTLRHRRVASVAFSPDGSKLASAGGIMVKLWDLSSGEELTTLQHTDRLLSVSFSPEGTPLACGTDNGTVELWDMSGWIPSAAEIHIPDPNLRAAIATALGVPPNATIRAADMTTLTKLAARRASIADLTGLESATNLATLILPQNSISDLSPLEGLIRLSWLDLGANSLSDISPLAGSTGLRLFFAASNKISDISPLAGLTDLTLVVLNSNRISDISPLLANTGLGAKDAIQLKNNPLSHRSVYSHIPILQERGVLVGFTKRPPRVGDVNRDGVVDVLDLVSVASALGNGGQHSAADVNGDGVVNIQDLVLVATALDDVAASPSLFLGTTHAPTAADVQRWLNAARSIEVKDGVVKRGIAALERLLESLTPRETALLPNYPNPFNPETWIPYQLAEDANVTLTIYDINGARVRRLEMGYQPAGYYTDRANAAYWDGRNSSGELVASGAYYYELATPWFRSLRRMAIVK